MKETGIVRRVDDLGRVVIPKEIRKTLNIKEGDPMEIVVDKDMVCFKLYRDENTEAEEIAKKIVSMHMGEIANVSMTGPIMTVVLHTGGTGQFTFKGTGCEPSFTAAMAIAMLHALGDRIPEISSNVYGG